MVQKSAQLLVSVLISVCLQPVFAADIYGYVPGSKTARKIGVDQFESYRTSTHGGTATWLAIVSDLNTSAPKVHIIDTAHFDQVPSKYGTHQAYAQTVGLSKSDSDYIKRLKADGRARSIMPFTLYVSRDGSWVLQNRRYVFADSSKNFAASLAKAADAFRQALPEFLQGDASFIAYQKAGSHYRPNTLTEQGQTDIAALENLGFTVITEDEIRR